VLLALTISAFDASCDLPPGPSTTGGVAETFTGTLLPQGSSVYMFTVLSAGVVSVHLSNVEPLTVALGLGVGTRKNDACVLTSSSPSAVTESLPQIAVSMNAGQYCVEVFDTGNVSGSASFSVVIKHS
jgi:hypothetical protein